MKSPAAIFRAEQRFKDKVREVTLFFAIMKRAPLTTSLDQHEKKLAMFLHRHKDNEELKTWRMAMKLISIPLPGYKAPKVKKPKSKKKKVAVKRVSRELR